MNDYLDILLRTVTSLILLLADRQDPWKANHFQHDLP